eukprot:jgi/Bigna1/135631/aug1.30_g10339
MATDPRDGPTMVGVMMFVLAAGINARPAVTSRLAQRRQQHQQERASFFLPRVTKHRRKKLRVSCDQAGSKGSKHLTMHENGIVDLQFLATPSASAEASGGSEGQKTDRSNPLLALFDRAFGFGPESNQQQRRQPIWYPPGARAATETLDTPGSNIELQRIIPRTPVFQDMFRSAPSFRVPKRLAEKNLEWIDAVNDFHFAMMNDKPRNDFYYDALKDVIKENTTLLEIGPGSGLLSMISASLGAQHVTAVEASESMAAMAQENIDKNRLASKIEILNAMSTDIDGSDLKHGKADVLFCEILGTLLLSENALEFTRDAKRRLLKPDSQVIPRLGTQFVTLVSSEKLADITNATSYRGLDFSRFNQLRDTASLQYTKRIGTRLASLDPVNVSERLPILHVDFAQDDPEDLPTTVTIRTKALRDGRIHAAVYSWEVFSDIAKTHKMSTHWEDTIDNFERDMAWGQGVQLLEDGSDESAENPSHLPVPIDVKKDDDLIVTIKVAEYGGMLQCSVAKA